MRKIILICFALISCYASFGQPIVNRAGASNTVSDARWQAQLNAFLPRYNDTASANLQKGIDSAGAKIYTRNPQAIWYRAANPKRWVREVDVENISSILDSAGVNISVIDSNTFAICNGAGVCDTFNTAFNYNTIQFITDSSIQYCSVDTVNGGVVSICDTLVVGNLGSPLIYQNWVGQTGNLIRFGSGAETSSPGYELIHNTYASTSYYTMNWLGTTIYGYPYIIKQKQSFQNSTGIVAFNHVGDYNNSILNNARLGINYTGKNYTLTPSPTDGYFGDRVGYWLGTNVTGNGSYGLRVDDSTAKTVGIFFNTNDTTNADAVTIFGAPRRPNGVYPFFNGQLQNYKIATFSTNGNLRFFGYDSTTRNDGSLTKALGVDEFGNVILGRVNTGLTVAYDSLFQTSDTSFALQRNDLTRDTVVVAWSAGDKNQIHVESWSDLTIVDNTIDSAQLKISGVTEGTYTNATIRVNDRGQITYAANGTSGGWRQIKFQTGVTTYAPASGDSVLQHDSLVGKQIRIYREGELQDSSTQYIFNSSTGAITYRPVLFSNERSVIEFYPLGTIINVPLQTPPTFTSTNRLAFYTNASMVRSGGNVTQWTNADGDATKNFVPISLNPEPIDAGIDGMQTTSATSENLKQATQWSITSPVTVYALVKKTGTGALLSNAGNTNGYVLYMDASSMFFNPTNAPTQFQTGTSGIANMSVFKVITIVWAGPGNNAIVYLDGVAQGTFSGTITNTAMVIDYLVGYAGNGWNGYIDGLAIFNVAHNATTVATQAPLFKTAVQ